nr:unnamed protein product [Callosobruchus chinensis]
MIAKSTVLFVAAIGLVFSQSLNDLESDDNLKKIQEHLPPELQNFNTSSLPKLEQVEKVLREKCQKELEKAKNTGSMDEVFGKYCKRWPDIQACFQNATSFARQCMDTKEQDAFNRSLTILQELQEFVCFKDGDRLAMFVAEGGIECMDEQRQGVQDCLNKTLGARLPDTDELDFDTVRTCINAELEKCKDSTPANIVDAFFKFLKKQMPCSVGSTADSAKEAASTQEMTSAANVHFVASTAIVSLMALASLTF